MQTFKKRALLETFVNTVKTHTPFQIPWLATVILLLLSFRSAGQDGGQHIHVWQNGAHLGSYGNAGGVLYSNSPTFTFTVSDDSITVPNLPCPGNPCGWYKGFWILGDGNYLKYPDDNANLDAASKVLSNYTYGRSGIFQPTVYLTEKYHNTKPPEEARVSLHINLGASGNAVELTKRLAQSPSQRIDIDYMHGLRVGYPSPFVLSYRKTEPATKLLFFYNGLNSNGTFVSSNLLDYQVTELPDYFFSSGAMTFFNNLDNPQGPYLNNYGGTVLERVKSKFKNCISYAVNNPGTVTQGFEELRVFPVLKTKNAGALPGAQIPADSVVFVSLLLGSQPVSVNDPSYSALNSTANTLLGSQLPSNLAISANEYIRGIAIEKLKIGTSHDPNHLRVARIESQNETYRVYFQLRICNHSETPEPQPSIQFKDYSNGLFSSTPVFVGLPANVKVEWTNGSEKQATLKGFQISGAPNHMETCDDLSFYIETDKAGVTWLKEQGTVLGVCVKFSSGAGECSDNERFIEQVPASLPQISSLWWLAAATLLFGAVLLWRRSRVLPD